MRTQRQVALAHSGVKLIGPAEGYGRKKELQVRQWLTNLPATDATLLPNDERSSASDFEDLPPLVQDLYRQLTDSTEGALPPAIDDAPTYPNSNIPRWPVSPKVASIKSPVPRTQSKVPNAPEPLKTAQQQPAVGTTEQSPSSPQPSQHSDKLVSQQPEQRSSPRLSRSAPAQPVSPSKVDSSRVAGDLSFVVSVSTLDAVSERASTVPTSHGRHVAEVQDQALLHAACAAVECPVSLISAVWQAADALLKQTEADVDSREAALKNALLQSVAAHEKYKQQVRVELQEARQAATQSRVDAAATTAVLERQLQARTCRAEQAEASLQSLQTVALQEKQKVQTLKVELDEQQQVHMQLRNELQQATESLQRSTAAHLMAAQQLEGQVQAAKLELQKAQEQATATQQQQSLLHKRLEAQVASLESELRACNASLAAATQEHSSLKTQLAAEAKARAGALEAEQAALHSLREHAELTAEMQQLLANSWVLQQRHNSSAARMAALAPSSNVAGRADMGRKEGIADRAAQLEAAEAVGSSSSTNTGSRLPGRDTAIPQARPASTSGQVSSPSQASRAAARRKEGSSLDADNDLPESSADDTRKRSSRHVSSKHSASASREGARTLSSSSEPQATNSNKDSMAKSRSLLRTTTAERRLLAEAQKAERRAAASAVLEESRLQEVALEAAPAHLRCLGLAFRICILAPDGSNNSLAQKLESLISTGYRTFLDPSIPESSIPSDNALPWTPQTNPVIPLCQVVIWLATPTIPRHTCEQLSQTFSQGCRFVILAPTHLNLEPQFNADWLAAGSTTPAASALPPEGLAAFFSEAWDERIPFVDGADLAAAVRKVALRIGVCDAALKLVPLPVLRRAKKTAHPDLLHLNLPGLEHLHLEGNSMPELTSGALDPERQPELSLGSSATADLCYALKRNTTIKLLTLGNLPKAVMEIFARAVTAEGCGVQTIHSHNDIPVGALLGRGPPCTELKLNRPLTSEDATVLSIVLSNSSCPPASLSMPSDPCPPVPAATTLCIALCNLRTLQKFNNLDLSLLEDAASTCCRGGTSILDMGGCVVGSLGAQLVVQRLQPYAAQLVHACGLNATGCQLTPQGLQQLLGLLAPACSNRLQVLCLADNKCGPEGIPSLASCFPSPAPGLAVLDLSMNCLSNEGVRALAPVLQNLPGLRCLGLGHNSIGSDGLRALCPSLTKLSQLQELQLPGNVLGDEGVVALASSLSALSNLEVLSLQDNYNLGTETGRCLGSALPSCSSLRQLNLAKTHLGPEGARHLAGGVQAAPALTTLNLELCKIRAPGAVALAGAVSNAPCLQEVVLARNGIGDAGASALAQALSKTSSLTRLDLRNNGIGQLGATALKALVSRSSCPLRSIALAGNRDDADLAGLERTLMTANLSTNSASNTATSSVQRTQTHQSAIPTLSAASSAGNHSVGSTAQSTGSFAQHTIPSLPSPRPSKLRTISASESKGSPTAQPGTSSPSSVKSQLIPAKPPSLTRQTMSSGPSSESRLPSFNSKLQQYQSTGAGQARRQGDHQTGDDYAPRAGDWEEEVSLTQTAMAGRLSDNYVATKIPDSHGDSTGLQGAEDFENSSDSLEAALERYRKK